MELLIFQFHVISIFAFLHTDQNIHKDFQESQSKQHVLESFSSNKLHNLPH